MLIRFYVEDTHPQPHSLQGKALTQWEIAIARTFGGYTKFYATGAYIDDTGKLVKESSIVYEIAPNGTIWDKVWAQQLGRILRQESVLVVKLESQNEMIEVNTNG